ncbi:MAG: Crp/Fnr family transcriptional regulator, partial [Wenzhouxiangellaceae bacterium]
MNTIDATKLKHSFLGEELKPDEIEALSGLMETETLNDGDVLVEEGAADPRLFLLADGCLEVWSSEEGDPRRVYVMNPGEFA